MTGAPGGLVVRMTVRVNGIALGGLGATWQVGPGGDDRPRQDRCGAGRGHGAIEPAKLNALEGRRAADTDHQSGGGGETEHVRAEQVLAGRKLVEGEGPLVGDRAGERDTERRDHRAAQRAARLVYDGPADGAGGGAGLESLGLRAQAISRTEDRHAGALRSHRDRCEHDRRYADERHRNRSGQAFHVSCLR